MLVFKPISLWGENESLWFSEFKLHIGNHSRIKQKIIILIFRSEASSKRDWLLSFQKFVEQRIFDYISYLLHVFNQYFALTNATYY